MIFVCAVIFLVSLNYIVCKKFYAGDYFCPFSILIWTWFIPLAGCTLNLSRLEETWSLEGGLILGLACLIMVGVVTIFLPITNWGAKDRLGMQLEATLSNRRFIFFEVVIFSFAIFLFCLEMVEYGVPIFNYADQSAETTTAHRLGRNNLYHIVIYSARIFAGVLIVRALVSESTKERVVLLLLLMCYFCASILKTSKLDIGAIAFSVGAGYFYLNWLRGKGGSALRRLGILFLVISVLFAGLNYLRSQGTTYLLSTISENIQFTYPEWASFAKEYVSTIYTYTSLSFDNFVRYVDHGSVEAHLGISLLRPFLTVLAQGAYADEMLAGIDWHYMHRVATVGTYLRPLYAEGGIAGVVVGAGLYSFFVNYIYYKCARTGGSFWFFSYLFVAFLYAFLFFMNPFEILNVYINFAILFLVYIFSRPKKVFKYA